VARIWDELRAPSVTVEEEVPRMIDARWDGTPDLTLEEI
jgi:hypothetical protein